jgi:lipopolysaccharide exporter
MFRMMTEEENGTWALFITITTVMELTRNGLIRNPMITFIASSTSQSEKYSVITASLIMHTIVVAIMSLAVLFGAVPMAKFWHAPQLDMLFYIYILRGFALIPCYHFEYIQHSRADFKGVFWGNSVRLAPLGIYTMIVYFLNKPTTLVELAMVQLISTIASAFVEYQYVKDVPLFYKKFDRSLVKKMLSFGKYTLGTSISSNVVRSTDSWMIGRMIGLDAVASYNPALRIANLVEVPTLAITNLVFPQVSRKMRERGVEGVQDVYIQSVSLILALMLPMMIPFYVLSDFIIETIFTAKYLDAAPILRITIFFMLILPFNRQFGTVVDALKRPKLNFYLLVMMGILNVILIFFLVKSMGLKGAAYGTLISYLIILVINQVILNRLYKINTFKVFPAIWGWYKMGWDFGWRQFYKIIGR